MMKKVFAMILALSFLLTIPAQAAEGNVIYDGLTYEIVFAPGSDHSLTDLFPDFKDVMPGDTLTQTITVRNEQSSQVKVEIYLRSLGAQEGSEEFLSQMKLKVAHSEENRMAYMFDAYANETAQLSDWVCLGMLYSGGEVNLDATLEVPVTMGNEFQDQIGYLDWEFMVIEYPVDEDDPKPPQTGDETPIWGLVGVMALAVAGLIVLLILMKRKQKEGQDDE